MVRRSVNEDSRHLLSPVDFDIRYSAIYYQFGFFGESRFLASVTTLVSITVITQTSLAFCFVKVEQLCILLYPNVCFWDLNIIPVVEYRIILY